jgi:hypothetical protein
MKKPNILEVKTLKKFSVRQEFIVEVSVEVYAESEYEAELIANQELVPIEGTDRVGWDYNDTPLDANGNCPLMDNVEVCSVREGFENATFVEIIDDAVIFYQCEEDISSDDTDTLFTNEEDAIDYWNDYHNTEEDEEV